MTFDDVVSGAVIRYPYLWKAQSARGESEGRKDRPVAVALRLRDTSGRDLVIMFPITSKPPTPETIAFEVPDREKRRAGLDLELRLWIVISEYNGDAIAKSYYLRSNSRLGMFSKSFFMPIVGEFIKRRAETKGVDRTL